VIVWIVLDTLLGVLLWNIYRHSSYLLRV